MMNKERNPAGKVLHDRSTGSKPSPAAGIGNERKPNVSGAQNGGSRAEAAGTRGDLGTAASELRSQHPHHHSVGGIHHTSDHMRHKPGKW